MAQNRQLLTRRITMTNNCTLICFALKEEAAPFRKLASDKPGISILLTGIGRQNAEKSVREFLLNWGAHASGVQFSASRRKYSDETSERAGGTPALPELVLTCGFAGGLNPDLKLGEVVFEVQSSKSKRPKSITRYWRKAREIFLRRPHRHDRRRKETIARANRRGRGGNGIGGNPRRLRERGIPCATVRVISDTADEDLPLDFNALAKADKNLDFGKLFLAVARSPGKIRRADEIAKADAVSPRNNWSAVLEKIIR